MYRTSSHYRSPKSRWRYSPRHTYNRFNFRSPHIAYDGYISPRVSSLVPLPAKQALERSRKAIYYGPLGFRWDPNEPPNIPHAAKTALERSRKAQYANVRI